MRRPQPSLEQVFESHILLLATTLTPRTIDQYRSCIRGFLSYLHTAFPRVRRLAQLRRDPHVSGWLRWLVEHDPPLCNQTRHLQLCMLRRVFQDLADNGHPVPPDMIRNQDFPPRPGYMPNPLSLEEDLRLDRELRKTDDLASNALLLMRATGIRTGECIDLPLDCLRQISTTQWALHVPLGKLHTERWVPLDTDAQRIVMRILALRAQAPASLLAKSQNFLLPRRGKRYAWRRTLSLALGAAARRAGCTSHVHPHRLRHTFASTMLRFGVSLPALMQLLGHKDIRMTLRYLQVTQHDLQREFQRAHQAAAKVHALPKIPLAPMRVPRCVDLATTCHAIAAARHLLNLLRYPLPDSKTSRKLRRLSQRLLNINRELESLSVTGK